MFKYLWINTVFIAKVLFYLKVTIVSGANDVNRSDSEPGGSWLVNEGEPLLQVASFNFKFIDSARQLDENTKFAVDSGPLGADVLVLPADLDGGTVGRHSTSNQGQTVRQSFAVLEVANNNALGIVAINRLMLSMISFRERRFGEDLT